MTCGNDADGEVISADPSSAAVAMRPIWAGVKPTAVRYAGDDDGKAVAESPRRPRRIEEKEIGTPLES